MKKMLTERELATVLAALRRFQQECATLWGRTDRSMSPEHFVEHDPLTMEQIDDLCERLNR
jgi:hypothetical protein